MTPRQRDLARHALGLDGARKAAYRNHFVAGSGHDDYEDWEEMVRAGLAVMRDPRPASFGGDDLFWLTMEAGYLACDPGESIAGVLFPA